MLSELNLYYGQEGISALDFRCQNLPICSEGNERFVEAKAAFVGTEYERGTLPRLLFVSLDPGSSERNPHRRTPEYVRFQEEYECNVDRLPKSRHWYRTHELALVLLKRFKPDLRIQDTHLYFAHVNTVKCCVSNDNHASASNRLFRNCRRYIVGELAVLRPDILVTQGKQAKLALEEQYIHFEISESVEEQFCSPRWVRIEDRQVLWLHTNHPRNFGGFNRQRRECYEQWGAIAFEWCIKMNS